MMTRLGERLDQPSKAPLVRHRAMYYGSRESWNLRDQRMFEPLQVLLAFRGPEAKALVWEHNSHIGYAAATEMGARGEFNVGQLARDTLRPAHPESYERRSSTSTSHLGLVSAERP